MSDEPTRPHPSPHPRPPAGDKSSKKRRSSSAIPNWLFYTVTLLVLGLWAGALVLTTLIPSKFQMPASLNAAVPLVLVGLYGTKATSDKKNDDGRDEE